MVESMAPRRSRRPRRSSGIATQLQSDFHDRVIAPPSASRSARLVARPRDLYDEEEAPAAPVAIDDEPKFPLVEQD
jgi:hypothetical protein